MALIDKISPYLDYGMNLLSIGSSHAQAAVQREYNSEEARKAFERQKHLQALSFQENQRAREWVAGREDTQYQRQLKDLLQAGFNPNIVSGTSPTAAVGGNAIPMAQGASSVALPSSPAPSNLSEKLALTKRTEAEVNRLSSESHYMDVKAEREQLQMLFDSDLLDAETKSKLASAAANQAISEYYNTLPTKVKKEVEVMEAQISNLFKDIEVKDSQIGVNKAHEANYNADTAFYVERKRQVNAEINESCSRIMNYVADRELSYAQKEKVIQEQFNLIVENEILKHSASLKEFEDRMKVWHEVRASAVDIAKVAKDIIDGVSIFSKVGKVMKTVTTTISRKNKRGNETTTSTESFYDN